jgi:ribose 5-phosphate isomerase RpiB
MKSACGLALEHHPPAMLAIAIATLRREGLKLVELARCTGESCSWVRAVADCLQRGPCVSAVIFCGGTGLAACVSNKVPGIRAASVATVAEAARAVGELGANVLIVDPADRTYFEFREILRLGASAVACPPAIAGVLQELDGHAHR